MEDLVVFGGIVLAGVGLGWWLHPGVGLLALGVSLMGTFYGWFVRRVK